MVQGLGWLVGLDSRGRGRKAKLSGEQKQALYELIVAGPQANGFDCRGVDLGDACGADLAALGCVLQPALPQQSVSETGAELKDKRALSVTAKMSRAISKRAARGWRRPGLRS
jgi:hypothetical protein